MNRVISSIVILAAIVWADLSSAEKAPVKNFEPKSKSEMEIAKTRKFSYAAPARKDEEEVLIIEPENAGVKEYFDYKAEPGLSPKERRDVTSIEIGSLAKEADLGTLSLNDCIAIAVKNYIPLQIAEKNVKLGEMRVWEARRNLLPSLTVRWEETDGRVSGRRYIGKKQSLEGQQAIFRGGELYFTMKPEETNLKIVKEEYKRITNDLILQVKKAYYTLGKAKENLKMQADLKKDVEAVFEMVKKGSDSGVISKLELLNVGSQASQADFQAASAEGDVSVAELILKQAMNIDPKDNIDVRPSAFEFKKFDIDTNEVLRLAFMNRPEMRINSMMVEYYNYERKISRAKFLPKIDVMGSWGLAKEEFASEDRGIDPDRKLEQQWYAGFKTSMPFWGSTAEYSHTREQWVPVVSTTHGTEATTRAIKVGVLDSLKSYSDKQAAEIDYNRARQEFVKSKQDITLEAREGCFSYEKAVRQLETAANKVKYQEKDVELIKLKRGMDEAQDSDVVERMIKLSQEKFGYVQALVDCNISIASINKAIGISDYFKGGEIDEKDR